MLYKINRVKEVLAEGMVAVGSWVQMASPEAVEMAGYAGMDFVIIDTEHGYYDLDTAENLIRAADASGTTPIVRVADHNPARIAKVLDAGAMGVLVPGVSNRHQAELVVGAARYSPAGFRGACPSVRAAGHMSWDWPGFVRWSQENIMVWLLVEGLEGVDNAEEIVAVPGVDAIVLGPFDLAQAMGFPGQIDHPQVISRLAEVIKIARGRGVDVISVLFEQNPVRARECAEPWVRLGCRIVTAGADKFILANGFRTFRHNLSALKA